jgi:hypothetical protein
VISTLNRRLGISGFVVEMQDKTPPLLRVAVGYVTLLRYFRNAEVNLTQIFILFFFTTLSYTECLRRKDQYRPRHSSASY